MQPNYERKPLINGIDLESAAFFKVDQIRLDQPAEKEINTGTLANQHGEVLLSSKYGSKSVFLNGHFEAPNRWQYEEGRDILLSLLDSEQIVFMTVEQSGEMRTFEGAYKNITFDYKGNGLVLVQIEFQITGAFGVSVNSTYKTVVFDEDSSWTIVSKGSIEALPKIRISFDEVLPLGEPSTLTLTTKYDSKINRMNITGAFKAGDTLIIDSIASKVTLNGSQIEYSGILPKFKGNTTLSLYDTAKSRVATVIIEFNERWL